MIAALALASGIVINECEWKAPRGTDAFQLEIASAVDSYKDIPPDVRAALKRRITARQYDEFATIKKGVVEGASGTYDNLREMHFGYGTMCTKVTQETWAPTDIERGLVYCEAEHCLIVPTVCRNVSRITRKTTNKTAGPVEVTYPPLEAPGGWNPDFVSPKLELGFVDPPATFSNKIPAPELTEIPEEYYDWPPLPDTYWGQWWGPQPALPQLVTFKTDGPVAVAAVPELDTYLLMLLGLAGVGFMARRGKEQNG